MMYMGNFTEGSLDATISAIQKGEEVSENTEEEIERQV